MKKQIRPELLICALAFGALCFLGGFFAGRNSLRPLDAVLAETAKTAADTEEAQDPDTEPAEPDTPAAEAADTPEDTAPEETAPGDPAEETPAEAPTQDEDGRIDLNTATAADLETLPGVGPVLAARILDYRAAYGPFRAVEELLNVSGIGEKKLEAIRSLVTVR